MATFILIHGSWHGAWCWERLIPALRSRGHYAIALDLPGMGADTTPLANATLQSWTNFVVHHLREAGEPVMLVGHSRGGVVISEAAEMAPECIQGLVYLTAVLLPSGASVVQLMEQLPAQSLAAIQFAEDGTHSVLDRDRAAALLYNTTPPEWVRLALGKLGPDPMQPNPAPLHLTSGRYGSVPRSFIECLQDRTLSIDLQRRMVQAMPCKRVLTLDTDHSPFLSAPERLAESLITTLQPGE
jgi:pimeloyl-ACP methyl ester carboxylesterase